MSSTGKTPKLGLCQWELSDQFRMEDMNEDFRKIDEAIGERTPQKLFDITVTGAVPTVRLDFSEIDVEQFSSLLFRLDVKTDEKRMRINGVSSADYLYIGKSSGGYTDYIGTEPGDGRLIIDRYDLRYAPYAALYYGKALRTVFPVINTIEFFPKTTSKPFEAGDRITVWGVTL